MDEKVNNALDVLGGEKILRIGIEPADLIKLFLVLFLANLLAALVAKRL